MASLAGAERDVGAKDELVLDGDRDADACIGAHTLGGKLAWSEGDVACIEEGIEAILADGVTLYPEIGYRLVEIDLGEEAVGRAQPVVN